MNEYVLVRLLNSQSQDQDRLKDRVMLEVGYVAPRIRALILQMTIFVFLPTG